MLGDLVRCRTGICDILLHFKTKHSPLELFSFHETPTTFVDLDLEGPGRNKIANQIFKPLVEKWSGIAPLELTAFYGIRE
jgi:hypothetical protein